MLSLLKKSISKCSGAIILIISGILFLFLMSIARPKFLILFDAILFFGNFVNCDLKLIFTDLINFLLLEINIIFQNSTLYIKFVKFK